MVQAWRYLVIARNCLLYEHLKYINCDYYFRNINVSSIILWINVSSSTEITKLCKVRTPERNFTPWSCSTTVPHKFGADGCSVPTNVEYIYRSDRQPWQVAAGYPTRLSIVFPTCSECSDCVRPLIVLHQLHRLHTLIPLH